MGDKKSIGTVEEVPAITKNINGKVYKVIIHFNAEGQETAQDKMKRLLTNSATSKSR